MKENNMILVKKFHLTQRINKIKKTKNNRGNKTTDYDYSIGFRPYSFHRRLESKYQSQKYGFAKSEVGSVLGEKYTLRQP